MATNPIPPAPDETTKIIGIAYIIAQLGWFLVSKWPIGKGKKKRATDEVDAIKLANKALGLQERLDAAETALDLRAAQIEENERIIAELEPDASEVGSLRRVITSLTTYNNNLEKENEQLKSDLADLRKQPTRQIKPPDVLDAGDGKPDKLPETS